MQGYETENDVVFISHGDCLEDAQFVAQQIKQRLGINNFIIDYVSPTIGAHSGPKPSLYSLWERKNKIEEKRNDETITRILFDVSIIPFYL